jgi:hypothetical protein
MLKIRIHAMLVVVVQQVMVQLSYPAIILPYQGAASMTEG